MTEQIDAITRAYERNGFMRLGEDNRQMGRRVEPGDYPAAHDDVSMEPPDPPDSDASTPSPQRRAARGPLPRGLQDPVSPTAGIRPPAWVLRKRAQRAERLAAAARAERDAAAAARAEADAQAASPADETQSPEFSRDDLPAPWILLRSAERAERAAVRAAEAAAAAEAQAETEDPEAEDDTLGMYDSV